MAFLDVASKAWRSSNAIVEDPDLLRQVQAQVNGITTSHADNVNSRRNASQIRDTLAR